MLNHQQIFTSLFSMTTKNSFHTQQNKLFESKEESNNINPVDHLTKTTINQQDTPSVNNSSSTDSPSHLENLNNYWNDMKTSVTAGTVGATVAGVATSVGIPAVTSAIGFGSGGVAAGTTAAGMMSAAGNVAAGSLVATLQSVGATGAVAMGTTVLPVAVVVGGGVAVGHYLWKQKSSNNSNNREETLSESQNLNKMNEGKLSIEKLSPVNESKLDDINKNDDNNSSGVIGSISNSISNITNSSWWRWPKL